MGLHMISSTVIETFSYVDMLIEPIMTFGVNLTFVVVCTELTVCGIVPEPL
jgi:hypothetical protein